MNDKDYFELCDNLKLALGDIRVCLDQGNLKEAMNSCLNTIAYIGELETAAKMSITEKLKLMGKGGK